MVRMIWYLSLVALVGITGCSSSPKTNIMVAEETLDQAKANGFDYCAALSRAEHGEREAVVQLLQFTPKTDAAGALGHACVLIELLQVTGDERFAAAAGDATKDVKESVKHLLEGGEMEMQLDLPLREQYPRTFGILEKHP